MAESTKPAPPTPDEDGFISVPQDPKEWPYYNELYCPLWDENDVPFFREMTNA
jgi:hypothetical protein